MKRIITVILVSVAVHAAAQYPGVNIPGSEIRKITSSIVTGQEYELQILLPGGYKSSTKRYPVVYLMDSQWDFPLVKSIYGQQYYDGFIPELILVGVTWGGSNPNADSLRVRDYTPTNDGRQVQSGGADKFLSFMKNELFPFIEKNYRVDPANRTLMGCSLGGLITLYALFTHTDMFNGYAAASPAIGWDRQIISRYEKEFALQKNARTARVYMTIGDVERGRPQFESFAEQMQNSKYSSVSVQSKVLENTGHSGTKSETFSRGLQYVFEKPRLKLTDDVLNRYTGNYTFGNGKIEIKNQDGGLVLYFSPTNKYVLYAASQTDFYATTEFFKLYFKTDDEGRVQGFQLDRYGNSQFIMKTN